MEIVLVTWVLLVEHLKVYSRDNNSNIFLNLLQLWKQETKWNQISSEQSDNLYYLDD